MPQGIVNLVTPPVVYDPENESQFRRQLERLLIDVAENVSGTTVAAHGTTHLPTGSDPYLHGAQHLSSGGDPNLHASDHASGGGDPLEIELLPTSVAANTVYASVAGTAVSLLTATSSGHMVHYEKDTGQIGLSHPEEIYLQVRDSGGVGTAGLFWGNQTTPNEWELSRLSHASVKRLILYDRSAVATQDILKVWSGEPGHADDGSDGLFQFERIGRFDQGISTDYIRSFSSNTIQQETGLHYIIHPSSSLGPTFGLYRNSATDQGSVSLNFGNSTHAAGGSGWWAIGMTISGSNKLKIVDIQDTNQTVLDLGQGAAGVFGFYRTVDVEQGDLYISNGDLIIETGDLQSNSLTVLEGGTLTFEDSTGAGSGAGVIFSSVDGGINPDTVVVTVNGGTALTWVDASGVGGAQTAFSAGSVAYPGVTIGGYEFGLSGAELVFSLSGGGTTVYTVNGTTGRMTLGQGLTVSGTTTLNSIAYTWPGADAAGYLTSDGAGALSWTAGSSLDAGTLDGIDSTGFFILAGQSGGQTGYGGTGASENLILGSTAHGTKGYVQIPTGDRFIFGADPGAVGEVPADAAFGGTGEMTVVLGSNTGSDARFMLAAEGTSAARFQFANFSDTASPELSMIRTRGSIASPTVPAADDILGAFAFRTYAGGGPTWNTQMLIRCYADQDQAVGNVTRLEFQKYNTGTGRVKTFALLGSGDGEFTYDLFVLGSNGIYGSASASGELQLNSTSDATKGKIVVPDGDFFVVGDDTVSTIPDTATTPVFRVDGEFAILMGSDLVGPVLTDKTAIYATEGYDRARLQVRHYGQDYAEITAYTAKGTLAAPTPLQQDDIIGRFAARGIYKDDGSAAVTPFLFTAYAAENWTDNAGVGPNAYASYVQLSNTVIGNTATIMQTWDENGNVIFPAGDVQVTGGAIDVDGGTSIRLDSDAAGATAIDKDMVGLRLEAKDMNTTSKYTPPVAFYSSDANFSTDNPKLLALIVGEAMETYSADTKGGMDLVFFTTPNNVGASSAPVEAFRIEQSKYLTGYNYLWLTRDDDIGLYITTYSDTAFERPNNIFRKSGGTEASPTAVQAGHDLAALEFLGYTGSAWGTGARIEVQAAETFSGSGYGSRFGFFTTDSGSTSLVERWRLLQDGRWQSLSGPYDFGAGAGSGIATLYAQDIHLNGTTAPQLHIDVSGATTGEVRVDNDSTGQATLTAIAAGNWAILRLGHVIGSDYWDIATQNGVQTLDFRRNGGASGMRLTTANVLTVDGQVTTPRVNVDTNGVYMTDSGGAGTYLTLYTTQGWIKLGPQNSSYCHFVTDRALFYFGTSMEIAGQCTPYLNDTYGVGTTSKRWKNVYTYNVGILRSTTGVSSRFFAGSTDGSGQPNANWFQFNDGGDTISGTSYASIMSLNAVYDNVINPGVFQWTQRNQYVDPLIFMMRGDGTFRWYSDPNAVGSNDSAFTPTERMRLDGSGDLYLYGAGRIVMSEGVIVGYNDSAAISFDGTDGAEVSGVNQIYEAAGTLRLSSRDRIDFICDNDNNSTTAGFRFYTDGASTLAFTIDDGGEIGLYGTINPSADDTWKLGTGLSDRMAEVYTYDLFVDYIRMQDITTPAGNEFWIRNQATDTYIDMYSESASEDTTLRLFGNSSSTMVIAALDWDIELGYNRTAAIKLNGGTAGGEVAGVQQLYNESGNFVRSSRSSIVDVIDNDNNTTSAIWGVTVNGRSTYLMQLSETGQAKFYLNGTQTVTVNYNDTAAIRIDGTDGSEVSGVTQLYEAGQSVTLTCAGNVNMMIDNDNNHTVHGFRVFRDGSTATTNQVFAAWELGNVVIGTYAALGTTATDGFIYIPTSAGAPTGVPTTYTGKVAVEYDTTNDKLMVYNGGWKGVTLA